MSIENHSFWNKQPVGVEEGANDLIKYPNKISTESYKLPEGFSFENISDYKELSKFLSENYVEDVDNEFRLLYSESFFSWFINNPKHKAEYSLGLKFNNYLVGYIFGKETDIMIDNVTKKVAAINFLCVTKDLRSRRITPILIKEITRRFNCNGVYQGIFTAGTPLFFEICSVKYWHMPLNIKKLTSVDYMDSIAELPSLKSRPETRLLEEKDIPRCYELYKEDMKKYKLCDNMDREDFEHFISNKIMKVLVNEKENIITSFGCYYILDTMAIKKNIKISGAYLSLVCGDNIKEMIEDLIHASNKERCDVFNGIDIGKSGMKFKEMGFLEGTGKLKYYLYNWKIGRLDKSEIFYYMH
ncbi:glycylpeptide N-tetradecanoyltransferase 1 [Vairimorpha necatrix]|uniref:Glycylpeptide N-tetradecanoyltransferase n=1 Tax=Vairimorpha necatrix TaxID=6039 RepID=A0AAX4J8Y8_9MICR